MSFPLFQTFLKPDNSCSRYKASTHVVLAEEGDVQLVAVQLVLGILFDGTPKNSVHILELRNEPMNDCTVNDLFVCFIYICWPHAPMCTVSCNSRFSTVMFLKWSVQILKWWRFPSLHKIRYCVNTVTNFFRTCSVFERCQSCGKREIRV